MSKEKPRFEDLSEQEIWDILCGKKPNPFFEKQTIQPLKTITQADGTPLGFGCLIPPDEFTLLQRGEDCVEDDDPLNLDTDFDMWFARVSKDEAQKLHKAFVDCFSQDNSEIWMNGEGLVGIGLYNLNDGTVLVATFDADAGVYGDRPEEMLESSAKLNEASIPHACKERCEEDAVKVFQGIGDDIFKF